MSFDKRLITHFNWSLLLFIALLFCVGLVNLYSASAVRVEEGIRIASYYQRQILWGGVGVGVMIACTIFDYRHLRTLAAPVFILSLLLLALVPVAGVSVNGAKRWLSFGLFQVQPSEVAKISVLIMGASLLSQRKESLGWRDLFEVFFLFQLTCALIFMQPDLGTTLNLLLLLGGMILYQGIKGYVFKVLCIIGPCMLPFGWMFLKEYQKQRILTFIEPLRDIKGAGYHIFQSQIAIGSGQMWGKGWQGGTQSLLRFLPEKHTDFAIAVFSEEWGFIGFASLLLLFCCFLLSIIGVAANAKDRFGSLLCAGIFFYFFWQILINIGMVAGIMPVVGIPLPFISYGGTATLVNFALLGLVMNVSMRRFMFKMG